AKQEEAASALLNEAHLPGEFVRQRFPTTEDEWMDLRSVRGLSLRERVHADEQSDHFGQSEGDPSMLHDKSPLQVGSADLCSFSLELVGTESRRSPDWRTPEKARRA